MLVANYVSNRPTMGATRTYEDFGKFLGEKAHRLGVISRLYPQYTTTFLTEALRNVYYGDSKKSNKFQAIDANFVEWELETNQIKRIAFAQDVNDEGDNGSEIVMHFTENYYNLHEIFKIDISGQQCMVVAAPKRVNDHDWEVIVRLVDDNYSTRLDTSACRAGDTTHFIGNAKPELHEQGFVKYQSNVEKMRNYITTVRVEDTYSSKYALMEDTLIKVGKGENGGEQVYKLEPMKKNLIENFLEVRENMMLLAKGNIDAQGNATISDRSTNRPIIIGDGIIPQIERFASKASVNRLSVNTFNQMLSAMSEKSDTPTGNTYLVMVNEKMWSLVQNVLGNYLTDRKADGAYLWSKGGDGKFIKVGATFDAYEFGGNTVVFKVDRTLSREYMDPYAVCIDLTTGKTSTQPPIAMFSIKNADFVINEFIGVGGKDGKTSGVVSSPVAGGSMIAHGYACAAVFNPYKSFILKVKQ